MLFGYRTVIPLAQVEAMFWFVRSCHNDKSSAGSLKMKLVKDPTKDQIVNTQIQSNSNKYAVKKEKKKSLQLV